MPAVSQFLDPTVRRRLKKFYGLDDDKIDRLFANRNVKNRRIALNYNKKARKHGKNPDGSDQYSGAWESVYSNGLEKSDQLLIEIMQRERRKIEERHENYKGNFISVLNELRAMRSTGLKKTNSKYSAEIADAQAGRNRGVVDVAAVDKEGYEFALAMGEAIIGAINTWRQSAVFHGIEIVGLNANGRPGCLIGPDIEGFIKTDPTISTVLLRNNPNRRIVHTINAIASTYSAAFANWQAGVSMPMKPIFPALAGYPGQFAPPTPSVPFLLSSLPSFGTAALTDANQLYRGFRTPLIGPSMTAGQMSTLNALAQALATTATTWMSTQVVTGLLGSGPVPSFSPPKTPAGPVVGGFVFPTPGILSSGGGPILQKQHLLGLMR